MARTCDVAGCDRPHCARGRCRKHYQRDWKAGVTDAEPIAPKPDGEHVCPREHKHGASGTCYVQHLCRCAECREGRRLAEARRRRLKAYGRYDTGLVPAGPAREHVLALSAAGIGHRHLAELAGVSKIIVQYLVYGRTDRPGPIKRVKRETAERILAVQPGIDSLRDGALVDPQGARRRIQALSVLGWSQARIAAEAGLPKIRINRIANGAAENITKRVHVAIAETYERLWSTPAPHGTTWELQSYNRTRNYAAARRWVAPLAWDDIDTDAEPPVYEPEEGDAGELIDETAVTLACAGESVRLTSAERRVAVRRLVEVARISDSAIAGRIGCTPETVLRIRRELGLATPIGHDGQVRVA